MALSSHPRVLVLISVSLRGVEWGDGVLAGRPVVSLNLFIEGRLLLGITILSEANSESGSNWTLGFDVWSVPALPGTCPYKQHPLPGGVFLTFFPGRTSPSAVSLLSIMLLLLWALRSLFVV